jgi:hypothetical protein
MMTPKLTSWMGIQSTRETTSSPSTWLPWAPNESEKQARTGASRTVPLTSSSTVLSVELSKSVASLPQDEDWLRKEASAAPFDCRGSLSCPRPLKLLMQ